VAYFEQLFATLRRDSSLDVAKGIGVIGYSVGAQFVSAMLEFSRDWQDFPTISAAVIVAGGSLYCYAYEGDPSRTKNLPSLFYPCISPRPNCCGCCPVGLAERTTSKVPTLLVQSLQDAYADPQAAAKYMAAVQTTHPHRPVCMSYDEGSRHGVTDCQVNQIIAFLRHHL
jgi:hypothetical protein